jgi:NADPH-dependent 2,4-dienoyl-CoA reductase/sulfur reductase-like enzyme
MTTVLDTVRLRGAPTRKPQFRDRSGSRKPRVVLCAANSASGINVRPKAVVIGGGWAGFGAAYSMLKAGMDVVVLDASERPGGLSTAKKTPGGRTIEPGIKG